MYNALVKYIHCGSRPLDRWLLLQHIFLITIFRTKCVRILRVMSSLCFISALHDKGSCVSLTEIEQWERGLWKGSEC